MAEQEGPHIPLVWFITGTSKGFGLALARAALQRKDLVIAAARSPDTAKDLIALQEKYSESCRVLQLDVAADLGRIRQCAGQAESIWGRVDVLVNNAGYSLLALAEEAGAEQLHELFKTNVYGPLNVTKAFLPAMRARKSGTIIFMGSRSGWRTAVPMSALYSSSKAALHAIADSLAVELKPYNIRVLNVVPGGLRTTNIESVHVLQGSKKSGFSEIPVKTDEDGISGYDDIFSMTMNYLRHTNGTQSGNPDRAANVIVDVVRGEGVMLTKEGNVRVWPGTLFLGSDSVRDVKVRCEGVLELLEEWGDVAKGIDYDS